MKFSILTLGCKSNQYESQAMAKLLTARGHQESPHQEDNPETVDAFLINTCSVTAVSDKKSRQLIRKIKKENPDTLVAVCGCYAQISPEEIVALEVDLVGGTGNHQAFILELETLWKQASPSPTYCIPRDNPRLRQEIESLPSGGLEGRTRALLKIQDGCDLYCTYCIIPQTRGKIRSLPLDESKTAILSLMKEGYQEIVLTGIEISAWGKDFSLKQPTQPQSLIDFLEFAHEVAQNNSPTPLFYRLGSLEPRTITEDFCSRGKQLQSLRPHFHLSLQSGSDSVLKRMNRKYDSQRFLESLTLLRKHWGKEVAITTDLIVGFPGETQEEFQQTLVFLEECQFSAVHVFPYSRRPGTPADKMPDQLTNEVKSARSKQVTARTKIHQKNFESQFLGTVCPVLLESLHGETWTGHSPQYIPIHLEGASHLPLQNTTHEVQITGHGDTGLLGKLLG